MLTFGVEFEFALAAINNYDQDPHPEDQRQVRFGNNAKKCTIYRSVSQALLEAGLYCDPEKFDDWEDPTNSSRWTVGEDSTIQAPVYEGFYEAEDKDPYTWYKIEVSSPALYFCPEAMNSIRQACQTITRKFRVNVNESCGLHVHVGNGVKGFNLDSLRKLISLLWTFEPQLERLHPEHRIRNLSAASLRSHSPFAVHHHGYREFTSLEACLYIFGPLCSTPEQLLNEFTGNARYRSGEASLAVNFSNLIYWGAHNKGTKRTIEYRLHEGTLDADRAVAWIEAMVGITEFAMQVAPSAFFQLMLDHSGKTVEEFNAAALFQEIGLPMLAEFYSLRLR